MLEILKTQYRSWKEQALIPSLNHQFIHQFERENLTKKLANTISGLA